MTEFAKRRHPTPSRTAPLTAEQAFQHITALEREMVEKALKDARFNKTDAARALGLTRKQLYVRLRRFGLE